MKKFQAMLTALITVSGFALAAGAAPADYGRVVINNGSQKAGLAPVVFDHWLHRAKYTCRLCHSDIGFALKAGASGITAADNMNGLYCGVCHNGKMQDSGKAIFAACSSDKSDTKRCDRCHSQGKTVKQEVEFTAFTANLPKDKFGNGVNWDKAAEDGTIKLNDYIEGVSIKKPTQTVQKDFTIKPKSAGMAEIVFSHKKHSAWNGCEICHPEIFKQGTTKYSMDDIKTKKFCGVCHSVVAFPLDDCNRCHSKPVK